MILRYPADMPQDLIEKHFILRYLVGIAVSKFLDTKSQQDSEEYHRILDELEEFEAKIDDFLKRTNEVDSEPTLEDGYEYERLLELAHGAAVKRWGEPENEISSENRPK